MMRARINYFYALFFVVLLTTEFYYIDIGGVARPYHFLAAIIAAPLLFSFTLLLLSPVFWALIAFLGINFAAAALSNTPDAAMTSLLAPAANMVIAMATAAILLRQKVDWTAFQKIILGITVISVLWGLFQIVAFSGFGQVYALSEQQVNQILIGFGPAFRTEANTFAKYMILPFFMFLPYYLDKHDHRHMRWVYLMFIIGILMNFTRSSLYGAGLALLYVVYWYMGKRQFGHFMRQSLLAMTAFAAGLAFVMSGLFGVSDYAQHKVENFFSKDEILYGESSAHRQAMMEIVLEDTLSDTKKLLIGNGWGQTKFEHARAEVQAGGGDLINVLGYSGVMGVIGYLGYTLLAFLAARRAALTSPATSRAKLATGVMFAIVGLFFTSLMSGYLITPEYWLLLGVCMYLDITNRQASKSGHQAG